MTSYTFITLNDPSAPSYTAGAGINALGEIVGSYIDGSGNEYGFLYNNGTWTTLDDPSEGGGADGTFAYGVYGVGNSGEIVGYYLDGSGDPHGFSYSNGTWTTLNDPSAGGGADGTYAFGVNASGEIVGAYEDSSNIYHGFLYNGGTWTTLNDPLGVDGTFAYGINAAGEAVGFYYDSSGDPHGFLYNAGTWTTLNDPSAGGGANGTIATGINDSGQIVGYYLDGSGVEHAFLYSGGTYTTIDDPSGTHGTVALGINDAGQISGYYIASNGHTDAFIASQPPTFTAVSENPTTGDLNTGDTVTITLSTNEAVTVSGTPTLTLNDNGTASYDAAASTSTSLVFDYTVAASNTDVASLAVTQVNLNGATIQDVVGNNANLSLSGLTQSGPQIDITMPAAVVPNDFNGDGMSDMLWRNSNGTLAEWFMDGSAISSSATPTYQGSAVSPAASWSVAGIGDFNGDGDADVLWRNSNGSLAEWLMDGSTISSSATPTYQGSVVSPDSSWNVAGVGDFNGGGDADILWRNSDGSLAMWLMDGSTITSSATPAYEGSAVSPGSSWSVAGIGDFTGANDDILWRNSNGSLAMWLMDGSTIESSTTPTYQGSAVSPGSSWSVAGIGDFNGDGNADILWRNSNGSLAMWLMDGSTIESSATPTYQGSAVSPDSSWNIVEIGDFNGSGDSDILWQQSTTGALVEWQMNGSQIVSSQSVTSQGAPVAPGSTWTSQAKPADFAA